LVEVSNVLAPVAQDVESKRLLDNCGHAVETSATGLLATARGILVHFVFIVFAV